MAEHKRSKKPRKPDAPSPRPDVSKVFKRLAEGGHPAGLPVKKRTQ